MESFKHKHGVLSHPSHSMEVTTHFCHTQGWSYCEKGGNMEGRSEAGHDGHGGKGRRWLCRHGKERGWLAGNGKKKVGRADKHWPCRHKEVGRPAPGEVGSIVRRKMKQTWSCGGVTCTVAVVRNGPVSAHFLRYWSVTYARLVHCGRLWMDNGCGSKWAHDAVSWPSCPALRQTTAAFVAWWNLFESTPTH